MDLSNRIYVVRLDDQERSERSILSKRSAEIFRNPSKPGSLDRKDI